MSKLFLIISFFYIVLANCINAQDYEWLYPLPQGNTINKMSMVNNSTAYAVGESGTILKSVDTCKNWYISNITEVELNSVFTISEDTVFTVGNNGKIFCTTNGGNTWDSISIGKTNDLIDIQFENNNGFIIGSDKLFLKSTDKGQTWDSIKIKQGNFFTCMDFIDEDNGWIAGGNKLLKTRDGGLTWSQIPRFTFYQIQKVYFLNAKRGFMIINDGIYRTKNGGHKWDKMGTDAHHAVNELVFPTSQIAYALCSSGTITKTTDYGATWRTIETNTYNDLYTGYFTSSDTGFIMGHGGTFIKTYDGGNTFINENEEFELSRGFNNIAFYDSLKGIAISDWGEIKNTNDGGRTWIVRKPQLNDNYTGSIYDISIIDSSAAYCVSEGALHKSTDNGDTWDTIMSIYQYRNVFFTSRDTGYISNVMGTLKRTYNGGSSWKEYNTKTSYGVIKDLFFTSPSTGFLCGRYGKIKKTSNYGQTWSKKTTNTSNELKKIFFINDSVGWCVGVKGTILKTINFGNTWTTQQSNLVKTLYSVKFIDENNGTIVGEHGTVLTTNDGGNNWVLNKKICSRTLETFDYINSKQIILFSAYRDIIKYGVNSTDIPYFKVNKDTIDFNSTNSLVDSIIINSNTNWHIPDVPDWLNFNVKSGNGVDTLIINAVENSSYTSRANALSFNPVGSPVKTVFFRQAGINTPITDTVCNSYISPSGNHIWTNSGVYYDTLYNCYGSDSILTIDLTIHNSNSCTDVITAYGSFTWIDGITYTESNSTATYTLTNIQGCDSVVTLDLTVYNSNSGSDVITACDSYTWIDGISYTESNDTVTYTMTNQHGNDSTVTLNLTILKSSAVSHNISACGSYTSPNGKVWTEPGTYRDTIQNAAGCDSIIIIDLDIGLNTRVFVINGYTLVAVQKGASYQWLDCGNGYMPLENGTRDWYSAKRNGSYAVEMTTVQCKDTSRCVSITDLTDIEQYGAVSNISIFPNPAQDFLNIYFNLENEWFDTKIELVNQLGQIVLQRDVKNLINENVMLPLESLNPGIYYMIISSESKSSSHKIIISR